MKTSKRKISIGAVVLVLMLVSGYGRLSETEKDSSNQAIDEDRDYCVGVEHPKLGLGLVCTSEASKVMPDAIRLLEVPSNCKDVPLPSDLPVASQIVLGNNDGECTLKKIDTLKGEMRLLAGGLLDANRDSKEDLKLLPGIGEVKAQRIVENRESDGPFHDAYDLTRVFGIGEKTAEKMEPWLEWK